MAVAGSSNLFLHIPAIACEAGLVKPWWAEFDRASHEIPLLSSLAPGGPYSLKDLEHFADALEHAVLRTIEEGEMTGDLALITSLSHVKKLSSQEFISAVRKRLEEELNGV